MSGRRKSELKGQADPAVERPVIWMGRARSPRWFGGGGSRIDIVTVIMIVVAVANAYFEYYIITVLLASAILMRWWLLSRQKAELGGTVEHEISPKGIRRGLKEWEWEEFGGWTVLKTKDKGVLDLVLRSMDGRTHVHMAMPEEALPHVEPLLDKRLAHYVP